MLKNYIKSTLRNLKRNLSNTVINILGLALGITSSLVMFLLYSHLNSFDKYQSNYENIYRIISEEDGQGGNRDQTPGVPTPFADAVRNDFLGLEAVVYISALHREQLVSIPNGNDLKTFYEDGEETRIAFTTQEYFTMLDFNIIKGNKDALLNGPNKVVLSKRLAKRYFGESDPLNKSLLLNKKDEYIVSGVMENVKENTDFPFEILFSYSTIKDEDLKSGWGSISSDNQCYVLLNPNQAVTEINKQFPTFIKKYFDEENEDNKVLSLQPMSNFHFNTDYGNYSSSSVSESQLQVILIIAIFLLATSCVNFINLSTAIAVKRAKEVGVRKVLGSTKRQLVVQFLGETFFITSIAIVISLGLAEVFLLYINPFLEINLDLSLFNHFNQFAFIISILVGVTILAGTYPAFVLSSFKPAIALKSKITAKGTSGHFLRKGLVIFQFFISQVFIIGTIILITQLDYLRSADLGFSANAVLNIGMPDGDNDNKRVLKNQLKQVAAVESVSLAYSNPSSGSVSITNMFVNDDPESYDISLKIADYKYTDLYDINILAGNGLQDRDTLAEMIVNEEFLKEVGIKSPEEAIGIPVKFWGKTVPIVGVMQNFHSVSLHEKMAPVALFTGIGSYRMASVKINSSNLKNSIADIERIWKGIYPDYNFNYEFVDDKIAEFYQSEQEMSSIFGVFAGIAIFIGCLGLYGLACFTVNQKVKEIGVRKVLGARVSQILYIFSKEFFILIIIAFAIAAPLTYFLMSSWLQDFEYRIIIGPVIFVIAIMTTIIIAISTVGYKTTKAALANPVNSLRDE